MTLALNSSEQVGRNLIRMVRNRTLVVVSGTSVVTSIAESVTWEA